MKRAIIVGIAAVLLALTLLSLAGFLELKYTQNGAFVRDWATKGAPDSRVYGDPIEFMFRWVRFNQFVISPAVSVVVGLFIGFLCRGRLLLLVIIGVLPIVVVTYSSDLLSVVSGALCFGFGWLAARSSQVLTSRRTRAQITSESGNC
ncbi:MAG TPA: hypothetical protein VMS96_12095 [Terriglobales bacterium]|nr:hypothetical protein [Terriglobales bacterium]